MRARLLDATLKVWASEEGASEAVVIRDVVEAAGVSRATFYKHFSSLDDAAAAGERGAGKQHSIRDIFVLR